MPTAEKGCLELLKSHTLPIVHMRQQKQADRLSLVFGAGASQDAGFPSWDELVRRVSDGYLKQSSLDVLQRDSGGSSPVAIAQLVYELFRIAYHPPDLVDLEPHVKTLFYEAYEAAEWRDHIWKNLYCEPKLLKDEEFLKCECYYKSFVPLLRDLSLTITFNFDDSIERFLHESRKSTELTRRRGYTTVWDENSQLPCTRPVIYHPNGFLAHIKSERPSTGLVFSESGFDEQLRANITGRHAILQQTLTQRTCLLIGISLVDPNLAFLLRHNALHHPGHVHYYVWWTGRKGEDRIPDGFKERAFNMYNLVCLELSTQGIHELAELLIWSDEHFFLRAKENDLETCFCFLVTGAVGSGKSSLVSHCRSLLQHDEWFEPRLPLMAVEVGKLTDDQEAQIDDWVARQFKLKNSVLLKQENQVGVHCLDRGALDPIAFTKHRNLDKKAQQYTKLLAGSAKKLVPAHIFLLKGDPEQFSIRSIMQGKEFSVATLAAMQEDLEQIYAGAGVSVIDTRMRSVAEVVKQACRAMFLKPYEALDLAKTLTSIPPIQPTLDLNI